MVIDLVLSRSGVYIPHVYQYGQSWVDRQRRHIPELTQSLCIFQYTCSGQERFKTSSSRRFGTHSDIVGTETAVAGIDSSCIARAKYRNSHRVMEYMLLWLWYWPMWSLTTLWTSTNLTPEWHDEPVLNHIDDIFEDSVISEGHKEVANWSW
jgi:hypothetical protein